MKGALVAFGISLVLWALIVGMMLLLAACVPGDGGGGCGIWSCERAGNGASPQPQGVVK